jgi:hypothetical protein
MDIDKQTFANSCSGSKSDVVRSISYEQRGRTQVQRGRWIRNLCPMLILVIDH